MPLESKRSSYCDAVIAGFCYQYLKLGPVNSVAWRLQDGLLHGARGPGRAWKVYAGAAWCLWVRILHGACTVTLHGASEPHLHAEWEYAWRPCGQTRTLPNVFLRVAKISYIKTLVFAF